MIPLETKLDEELKDLFLEILISTTDMYLRPRFEYFGFKTSEHLVPSPSKRRGIMELLPIRTRIELYLQDFDFDDPQETKKLCLLVNEALSRFNWDAKSDLPETILRVCRNKGIRLKV